MEPWKLLLIEDDEDDYIVTRSMLADAMHGAINLQWVDTYEAGLEALRNSSFDAVLVDYHL